MKKTLVIPADSFNLTIAKVAMATMAQAGEIEKILAEFIRLNDAGIIVFDYKGLNECAQRLDINYQTFRTCINRLVKRGMIKRAGHAIYLHPMISGQFKTFEVVSL